MRRTTPRVAVGGTGRGWDIEDERIYVSDPTYVLRSRVVEERTYRRDVVCAVVQKQVEKKRTYVRVVSAYFKKVASRHTANAQKGATPWR